MRSLWKPVFDPHYDRIFSHVYDFFDIERIYYGDEVTFLFRHEITVVGLLGLSGNGIACNLSTIDWYRFFESFEPYSLFQFYVCQYFFCLFTLELILISTQTLFEQSLPIYVVYTYCFVNFSTKNLPCFRSDYNKPTVLEMLPFLRREKSLIFVPSSVRESYSFEFFAFSTILSTVYYIMLSFEELFKCWKIALKVFVILHNRL